MKRHQQDELRVVYDILSSAATGQMHAGDSVGLWTFNQDVHSDLPAQIWTADNHDRVINRTLNFLQQHQYAKASRLDKALSDMRDVIQASDIITIFIISNGHGKMAGTPFDKDINALYKQNLDDMKREPRPVITVLQGKGGKIVRFTVNALPWPVVIPEIPIPIRTAQTAPLPVASAAPTQPAHSQPAPVPPSLSSQNPGQPAASPATAAVVPSALPAPVLRPEYTAPVVPSAQIPPPIPGHSAPAVNPPPAAPQTTSIAPNAPDHNVSAPPPLPLTKPQILTPQMAKNPALPRAPAPLPSDQSATREPSNSAAVAPAPVTPAPRPQAKAAVEPLPEFKPATQPAPAPSATNSFSTRAYAFVTPEVAGRPKSLLIAAAVLLMLAVFLIFVMLRRSRTTSGPSLISHSMGNGRKKDER